MALKYIHIDSLQKLVSTFKNKYLQAEALALIPTKNIWSKSIARLRDVQAEYPKISLDEAILLEQYFLEEFILWFKNDFFTWFDTPNCSNCINSDCEKVSNISDPSMPYIVNTEVFECRSCHAELYFHRYNDTSILLKTRRGRCTEFAQVFTVMCLALNHDARFIFDISDHVWTEVYSHLQGRWIHCDPSEGIIDKPLMYESGWGKNPILIMSFSPTMEIQDVTWRYSADHKGILSRRDSYTNDLLPNVLLRHNTLMLENCSRLKKRFLLMRLVRELAEFMTEPNPTAIYSGRISGSLEWRKQRGEVKVPVLHTGFIFELRLSKMLMKPKYYCMWYSANHDSYVFYCDKGETCIRKGWKSCLYSHMNIIRKEELDWGQTYLARERNGMPGNITWKFDVSHTSYFISGLLLKTSAFFIDTGVVEFRAVNNKNHMSWKNGSECIYSSLSPDSKLSIEVILSGGEGTVSWQQAQIGRQSKNEGSAVSVGVVLFLSSKS